MLGAARPIIQTAGTLLRLVHTPLQSEHLPHYQQKNKAVISKDMNTICIGLIALLLLPLTFNAFVQFISLFPINSIKCATKK